MTLWLAASACGHSAKACVVQHGGAAGRATTHAGRTSCPNNPLLGVYDPTRLEVRQQCVWFTGTVTDVGNRNDGDHHLDVAPAAGFDQYLNKGNRKDQNGAMVVELMPGQDFPVPQPGDQISVFGTWVHDQHNDWNEIHPVWTIQYAGNGSAITSLPPRIPEYACSSND